LDVTVELHGVVAGSRCCIPSFADVSTWCVHWR